MTLAFAPLDGALNALTVGVDSELPCRQYDPDLWFADVPADLEVAKTLCGGCPLKVECLAGALERGPFRGVHVNRPFTHVLVGHELAADHVVQGDHRQSRDDRAEPWGVWGGEIFERGAVVPRKRPRGRPRKEDVARDAVLRVEVANRTNALVAAADLKVA